MSERADDPTENADATRREGPSERRPELSPYLDLGALVGRYIVLERIGEGGMGVVYSAFDPELDRKVAIKLLQAQAGGSTQSGGEQAWLLREAQALARLAHPNVVAVHDVGTLPGDRVFVAMELVDGDTLRSWLETETRTWRDVLPILIAAGKGLAAAHAAGLVHRDFKPDNVLVGKDGRVRVMDFGLARTRPGDTSPASRTSDLQIEVKSPLSESLTMVGTVVGTPAYLAPEIHDGRPADATTDQFSFGVTLFEALFRARPYTREQLTGKGPPPKPKLPADTGVPMRIQRAVLRAVAIDPAQRYPTMEALLDDLAIDPRAQRKIWLAAGIAAIAVAGGTGAYIALSRSNTEPCRGIEQRLAGVWDPTVKTNVRAGFLATKRSFAAQSFAQLEKALDGYAGEWTATAVESCKATRVRRDQTEEVLSLRQSCLEQRLEELRALGEVLADPHPLLLDKADKIVGQLEPVATCSNVAALRAPDQPPAQHRAQAEAIRKQIAEARANVISGRYLPALVGAQKAIDEARKIGYEPFAAEAIHLRATALIATGNPQDASTVYRDAVLTAIRARRDDVAAAAGLAHAMLSADALAKPGEAKLWLGLAETSAKRAGLERTFEARAHMAAGIIAGLSGNPRDAVAAHEKMLRAQERLLGHDEPAIWADEVVYATSLTKAQQHERAVKHFEHALALREQAVGDEHADIAMLLSNLGISYRHTGQHKKARAAFERALAIRERLFGKKNPLLVPTLVNFSEYFVENERDPAAALPLIERALALAKQLPGEEHFAYHETATTYTEVLAALGRVAEARKLSNEVLAIERRVGSVTLPITQMKRAELELRDKAFAEAAAYAERAIAGFEEQGGADNPELWRPLTRLAQAKLGQGDRRSAKQLLERAVAAGERAGVGDHVLGETRTLLASLR